MERFRTTIDSFVTPENSISVKRLQINFDILSNAEQHHHPLLVGASTAPQHGMKFTLGDAATTPESKCSLTEVIIRFFKEVLTTVLGGVINMHHADVIEYSLHKIFLHVGHVLRHKSQNMRMSEVMKESTGGTLVITMCYMMKYEDTGTENLIEIIMIKW